MLLLGFDLGSEGATSLFTDAGALFSNVEELVEQFTD